MLKQLIFLVDKNIELPKYEDSEVQILNADTGKTSKEDTIYICDDSKVLKKLYAEGQNVVALLTEKNSGEDFSFCKYAVQNVKECEEEFFQNILKRFMGMPWDIMETKRCLIRETSVEDVDAFYELYEDEEITRYMEPLFEDRDEEIEYTKSYIKNVYEFYGFGMWTIVLKDNGEVIGRAGVSYREGFEHPELGFMIGTKYQRQGLAYEVCSAILEYMHENYEMEEILIFIEPQNTPSILLAKKLGASFYKEQCMGKCDAYIIRIPQ